MAKDVDINTIDGFQVIDFISSCLSEDLLATCSHQNFSILALMTGATQGLQFARHAQASFSSWPYSPRSLQDQLRVKCFSMRQQECRQCDKLLQGREKDIAIFSAVRSVKGPDSTIGFVADERRVNVALTRARCSMLVVGNAMALENSDTAWSRLLSHARLRRYLPRSWP